MQLSERFLNLVHQQLASLNAEPELQQLIVYVAQSRDGQAPTLEAIGHSPTLEKALPPVEADPELRTPSPHRRWYPLQDGSLLIGVLRVERFGAEDTWPESLDQRLQFSSAAIAQYLALELDRQRLLDELSKQREQITFMVHQLRNPLTALRTYAQLLLKKLGPDNNNFTLVEGLLSEQAQLDKYISALDQLSRPKLLSPSVLSVPLLLPPVLPEAASFNLKLLLEPLIDRAAATATLEDRAWVGPINWPDWTKETRPSGDGVLAEIVANLLENAFRYSSSASPIGLSFMDRAICIWDGGRSIDIDEREKIFQKGFRGKKSFERPGSGLGLALGRQLAEQIGGSLQLLVPPGDFDSSLPNQGNAFVITLPGKEQSKT